MTAQRIRITGLVQGVGFRPNVWRLAQACHIAGTVRNDSSGVLIEAWGSESALAAFQQQLRTDIPPLAHIERLQITALEATCPHHDFRIIASESGEIHTSIVADAATCAACRADIFDVNNRRYRYPFTNCTHCGPRLSIVRTIPYDRANTSMAGFRNVPTVCANTPTPLTGGFMRNRMLAQRAAPRCGWKIWRGKRFQPMLANAIALIPPSVYCAKGIFSR